MIRRWSPLIVFALSLLYWQVGLTRWLNHVDEGIADVGATRVLAGELPYRDFFTYYAPGQDYLLAGLFRLVGPSVLATRVLGLLVVSGLLLLLFLIARELAGPGWAWLAWLLALTWRFGPPLALALHSALLLEMASVLCFVLFLRRGGRWLVAAGALTGLAVLFRHDLGLYTALAETLTLAAYLHLRSLPWRALWSLLLPLLLVVLPVAAYFVLRVPWSVLVYDFYTFPFRVFSLDQRLPYPTLFTSPQPLASWWWLLDPGYVSLKLGYLWPFYFPPLVYLATLLWLARQVRRGRLRAEDPALEGGLLLLALALLQFNYARVTPNLWHLWPFALPATVLLPLLLARAWPRRATPRGPLLALGVLTLATLLVLSGPQLLRWSYWVRATRQTSPERYFIIPRAAGMVMEPEERGYQAALAWVLSHVPSGETIYVGHDNHSRDEDTDVLFYFLAERPPATSFHELVRPTPSAVQAQIMADLEAHRTRFAVLDSGPAGNPQTLPPPATPLDAYLRSHFVPVARYPLTPPGLFGAYTLLVRKPGA